MTTSNSDDAPTRLTRAVERAQDFRSDREDSPGQAYDCRMARAVLLDALAEVAFDGAGGDDDARDAVILLAESWNDDSEVNPERAADEALQVLNAWFDLRTTDDVRVLQIAGQVHQRRWELSAQWRELRRALYLYERADRIAWHGADVDLAARIRLEAAFLLDALARQEERALHDERATWSQRVPVPDSDEQYVGDTKPPTLGFTARELRAEAEQLRTSVVKQLEDPAVAREKATSWQYYLRVAEAHAGLRDYDAARRALERGQPHRTKNERELQGQAKRLIELVRMRGIRPDDGSGGSTLAGLTPGDFRRALDLHREHITYEEIARALDLPTPDAAREAVLEGGRLGSLGVIRALLARSDGHAVDEDMIHSAFRGKLGLALSGGGFRASLFHIGVLAQLAERGLLHQVHTISCVSGGSILGAQYYLMVKELLEGHSDEELKEGTNEHYIRIVQQLVDDYEKIAHTNLRARIFLNPLATAGLWPSPSRRMGRLMHKHVLPGGLRDLRDLAITPKDWPGPASNRFRPNHHNWSRAHKVPILILNATSLNTGHSWQFTSRSIGEPTARIASEIESSARLGRVELEPPRRGALSRIRAAGPRSLREPESARQAETVPIRIGEAVAASAAVPGLFQPLQLAGLYPDWLLKLADGGVVDNQGIGGLLDRGADTLFISDASRQLKSSPAPAGGFAPVMRSNSIAYHRIRAAQYDELRTRRRSGLIRDFLFVHFNRDLEGPEINPRSAARGRLGAAATRPGAKRFRVRSKVAAARLQPPDWTQQMTLTVLNRGPAMSLREIEEAVPDIGAGPVRRAVGSLIARGLVVFDSNSLTYTITPTGSERAMDSVTSYGVARSIQNDLARVRTDLNAFSQAESYALMTSGYLMTKKALTERNGIGPFRVAAGDGSAHGPEGLTEAERARWKFLVIAPVMGRPGHSNAKYQYRLERHLTRSSLGTRIAAPAWRGSAILLVLAALTLFVATQDLFSTAVYSVPVPRLVFGLAVLALIAGGVAAGWARITQRAPMRPFAVLAKVSFLLVALFLAAASMLALVAGLFPDRGRVDRFLPPEDRPN